jgi:hypothetical protein
MFCTCLLAFVVVFLVVVCNSELMDPIPQRPGAAGGGFSGSSASGKGRSKIRMR